VNLKKIWEVREFSTVVILALEILFFTWYLWPDGSRSHPFFNAPNFVLIFKYSAIYGIAAVGAAILFFSSELAEFPLVCDRVITVFGGRVTGEMAGRAADEAALLYAMHGLVEEEGAAA